MNSHIRWEYETKRKRDSVQLSPSYVAAAGRLQNRETCYSRLDIFPFVKKLIASQSPLVFMCSLNIRPKFTASTTNFGKWGCLETSKNITQWSIYHVFWCYFSLYRLFAMRPMNYFFRLIKLKGAYGFERQLSEKRCE